MTDFSCEEQWTLRRIQKVVIRAELRINLTCLLSETMRYMDKMFLTFVFVDKIFKYDNYM